ncbi:MAG TPA: YwqJ-related putative deaminase, partial [Candidatus Nanopelagicales bacterium]|nr:YwqJ-related putative deaminase [Candidatus Nanopelagicales bacterium]
SSGASSGNFPLHPAVAAALPPTNARDQDPNQAFTPPPGSCSEPAALSERLYEFQRRTGRMCYPTGPNDDQWRQNLSDALEEVERSGDNAISSVDESGSAAACSNCSQMIGRLWALGGRTPPNNLVGRGRETGVADARNPRQNVRTSRPSEQYESNATANAGVRRTQPETRPVQPGMGKIKEGPFKGQDHPPPHPFPDQNLGVWSHDDQNGWQRAPGT